MAQPWRYRCPRGHSSWVSAGDGYRCERCFEGVHDAYFDELVDMKTDTL